MSTSPFATMRALSQDRLDGTHLRPGTARRVLTYAQPHRTRIALFIVLVICDALLTVAPPLLLRSIIDDGVITHNTGHVIRLSLLVAAIALLGATLTVTQRWLSATIGEGVIYDLRTHVFNHVSTQPIAFFTRVHTGALVSRLNTDVIGAQQAFTSTLSGIVSNTITLLVIIATMSSLSWPLTIAALLLFPLFLIPARSMGTRLGALTRRAMNVNADLATRMTERFDVSGALLVKLFGNPHHEATQYAQRAGAVRDIGIRIAMNRSIFMTTLTLLASLATALIYGLGGVLASNGTLTVGTLLALTALLARLYTPLIALSNIRVDILTALISFERVFEVLDLPNSLPEPTHPHPLP
ncbi:ABC transporter ATP-binding protein, partial [Austwickia sp. TVS 96-490-7B]|uniref:ABC transporter ATP-binding protein n=1 Tax=Austwickia sp. TVS 96-490-7B TaxID=2830843 RepID=UPI002105650E